MASESSSFARPGAVGRPFVRGGSEVSTRV